MPAPDPYRTPPAASRARQHRLLDAMRARNLDLVILTQNAHVQYFVGPRFDWKFAPAAAIAADGHVTLVAPAQPGDEAAADDVRRIEVKDREGKSGHDDGRSSATERPLQKPTEDDFFRETGHQRDEEPGEVAVAPEERRDPAEVGRQRDRRPRSLRASPT